MIQAILAISSIASSVIQLDSSVAISAMCCFIMHFRAVPESAENHLSDSFAAPLVWETSLTPESNRYLGNMECASAMNNI